MSTFITVYSQVYPQIWSQRARLTVVAVYLKNTRCLVVVENVSRETMILIKTCQVKLIYAIVVMAAIFQFVYFWFSKKEACVFLVGCLTRQTTSNNFYIALIYIIYNLYTMV